MYLFYELEKGEDYIRKSIKNDPKNSYSHNQMALIKTSKDRIPKTCFYLKRAYEKKFSITLGNAVDSLNIRTLSHNQRSFQYSRFRLIVLFIFVFNL